MTTNYRGQPRWILYKGQPGEDAYVAWSSIVEAPVYVGTRAEMIEHGYDEERIDRADKKGTSAFNIDDWWNETAFHIAEQRGILRRTKLVEYSRLHLAGDKDAAYALLEPFDDDEED